MRPDSRPHNHRDLSSYLTVGATSFLGGVDVAVLLSASLARAASLAFTLARWWPTAQPIAAPATAWWPATCPATPPTAAPSMQPLASAVPASRASDANTDRARKCVFNIGLQRMCELSW